MKHKLLWLTQLELNNILDSATWLATSSELVKLGWDVSLVGVNFPKAFNNPNIEKIIINKNHIYLWGFINYQIKLCFLVLKSYFNYDVILFHQTEFLSVIPGFLFSKVSSRVKPKFVLDSRTVPMDLHTRKGRLWNIYFSLVHHLANFLVDGQTSNSLYMASMQKVKESKLLGVWPAGVDIEEFSKCYLMRKWPSMNDDIIFIYIGALAVERNLLSFCKAIRKAKQNGFNVKFMILGNGPQFADLVDYSKSNLPGLIRVFSPVAHNEVPFWLTMAHVGVIPFPDIPIFRTGTPIKQFEYLASGLPILATRVICHTDFLSDNCTFWADDHSVDSMNTAIIKCCEMINSLPKMGKNAMILANNYSWKKSAEKLSFGLESIID